MYACHVDLIEENGVVRMSVCTLIDVILCYHSDKDYEGNGSDVFSTGLTSQTHHLQKSGEKGGGNFSSGGSNCVMGHLEL